MSSYQAKSQGVNPLEAVHLSHVEQVSRLNFAIVKTHWNASLISQLEAGIEIGFQNKLGIGFADNPNNHVFEVPGAIEIPLMVQKIAQTNVYDLVFALGVVIRGDTPHFDYVCQSVTEGLIRVTLDTGVPVIYGILTVDNLQQAMDRLQPLESSKGVEFAVSALQMLNELHKVNILHG